MTIAAQRSGSSVRSENYCFSSIRVASIDENKNSHRKITMTHTQNTYIKLIALRAGKKGAWPAGPSVRKISYGEQATKTTKMQKTIQIATFDVRTLNKIRHLPVLTASAVEHDRHNMHTKTQIHAQTWYQISRYWQWMDASLCISIEKLRQCHSRRCRHTYSIKSVKITL